MSLETIIINLSYFGIFLLMIINGIIGFPSSQIIFIFIGFLASLGNLNIYISIILGGFAMAIGNMILYEISKKKGLKYIESFKIFPIKEIKKVKIAFQKKGIWFLIFGKLVNPIRIILPIVAGITKMNRFLFFIIVWIMSTIYVSIFAFIGYFFGQGAEFMGWYAMIILVFAITIIYIFYKYANSDEIKKELLK